MPAAPRLKNTCNSEQCQLVTPINHNPKILDLKLEIVAGRFAGFVSWGQVYRCGGAEADMGTNWHLSHKGPGGGWHCNPRIPLIWTLQQISRNKRAKII